MIVIQTTMSVKLGVIDILLNITILKMGPKTSLLLKQLSTAHIFYFTKMGTIRTSLNHRTSGPVNAHLRSEIYTNKGGVSRYMKFT